MEHSICVAIYITLRFVTTQYRCGKWSSARNSRLRPCATGLSAHLSRLYVVDPEARAGWLRWSHTPPALYAGGGQVPHPNTLAHRHKRGQSNPAGAPATSQAPVPHPVPRPATPPREPLLRNPARECQSQEPRPGRRSRRQAAGSGPVYASARFLVLPGMSRSSTSKIRVAPPARRGWGEVLAGLQEWLGGWMAGGTEQAGLAGAAGWGTDGVSGGLKIGAGCSGQALRCIARAPQQPRRCSCSSWHTRALPLAACQAAARHKVGTVASKGSAAGTAWRTGDQAARAAVAVAELRGDGQLALLAHAACHQIAHSLGGCCGQ